MPNCDFYATAADHAPLLEWLFAENTCAVYEAYSPGEAPLRCFASADEVLREFGQRAVGHTLHLALHVNGSGPMPKPRRIDLVQKGQAALKARYRYCLEGWGLVQFQLCIPHTEEDQRWLGTSYASHNSQKRARRWEATYPEFGSPDAWDFKKIAAFSSRLNRQIRKCAVAKWGGRSILADAWAEWENGAVLDHGDFAPTVNPEPITDLREK